MDCNSIIYDVLRKMDISNIDFENELIESVILKIEDYIQEINLLNV